MLPSLIEQVTAATGARIDPMQKYKMNSLISRLQRPGYDLQKEQAIQEAIVMLRQCNAQSKPDCGEAGHDEGRCGNVQCLPGGESGGMKND